MKPEVIVFIISILLVFWGVYIRENRYYLWEDYRDRVVGTIFILAGGIGIVATGFYFAYQAHRYIFSGDLSVTIVFFVGLVIMILAGCVAFSWVGEKIFGSGDKEGKI